MKSGLEIAQEADLRPITEIAASAGIPDDVLEPFGRYRAKVDLVDPRPAGRPARRQAGHHDGDHADEGRRGQDHDVDLADAGPREDRQGRPALPPRTLDGSGVRHQGRRHRRRLRAGRADGGHQPPLQRRLPRRHGRPQPAGVRARRLALLRQPARYRRLKHHLAADARCQRARAPVHGHRPRREDARRPARERVRDHRGVGGDGRARPRVRSRGPPRPPGADRRRVDGRRGAGHGRAAAGRRGDGRDHEGRPEAQPRADARGPAGADPRRSVRQRRPRQQLDHRGPRGAQARGLRDHRGRVRERPGVPEVLRHRVPVREGSRPRPGCS